MKNVYEVLRQKELELTRLEKEVEALRVAAPLLSDDKDSAAELEHNKPTLAGTVLTQQPIRIPQPAAAAAGGGSAQHDRPCRRVGRFRQALAINGGLRPSIMKYAEVCRSPGVSHPVGVVWLDSSPLPELRHH